MDSTESVSFDSSHLRSSEASIDKQITSLKSLEKNDKYTRYCTRYMFTPNKMKNTQQYGLCDSSWSGRGGSKTSVVPTARVLPLSL